MKLEELKDRLESSMKEKRYSKNSIYNYLCLVNSIMKGKSQSNSIDYTPEVGITYLRNDGIFERQRDEQLTQSDILKIRIINILNDLEAGRDFPYRYSYTTNKAEINNDNLMILKQFENYLVKNNYSIVTVKGYIAIVRWFIFFLEQNKVNVFAITPEVLKKYQLANSEFSYKTVEKKICAVKKFLKFLYENHLSDKDFSKILHMPQIRKNPQIPSAWSKENLLKLLNAIDQTTAIGQRDYAMIKIASSLGMRIGDISNLRTTQIDWKNKSLKFVQSKTGIPCELPLPEDVGWAIINYMRNGRPKFKSDLIFLSHMPPFKKIGGTSIDDRIKRYMKKAGIKTEKVRKTGMHSLRHTVASALINQEVPLHIISDVLGHASQDAAFVYLEFDIEKLRNCILPLGEWHE